MPAISASAPGKIILFGEHAVVYSRPAIAVPVTQVRARVVVLAEPSGPAGRVHIQAPDIQLDAYLDSLPENQPLAAALLGVMKLLGVQRSPACTLRISSTIPLAGGLGSGAAVSVAIIRAYAAFLGRPLPDADVSNLVFEVEKLHHGTPSGIDNTVITYAVPVYFVRGQPIETFPVNVPFTMVIGDTGIASPTSIAVGDVRRAWHAETDRYERLFDAVGMVVQRARQAIAAGDLPALGELLDENQRILREIGVSSPELERLISAAHASGALGAKLSGGGRGGNMIALCETRRAEQIAQAISEAGAVHTITTVVQS
jgi:mevalonate kinase